MFVLATWIALAGVCIYRTLVLALPFFHEAVAQTPVLNVLCGSLSDLSVTLLLAVLWLGAARFLGPGPRRVAGRAALVLTCVYVYSLAAHVRYVEHFGMNARPYHTVAMENGEMWTVGTMMVLTSARAWGVIGTMLALLVLFRGPARRVEAWWAGRPRASAGGLLVAALVGAVAAHSGVIQLRNRPGVHPELRYSVYEALYFNFEEYKHVKAVPPPSDAELARIRELLPGPRSFAAGDVAKRHPLWQTRISAPSSPNPDTESLRAGLRAFIARTTEAEGPWNVVVVLSESLRANELESMGSKVPEYQGLTPGFSEIARDGIRFSEVMSSGLRTHFGQTASQCSLNGALDYTILQGSPMTDAVCLGDVFQQKGYDTYFFYGADNHFDNQDIFYQKHGTRHVEDENQMPKGGAKAGWGYSDAYLFQHVRTRLADAKKPFFAVVLTLSNHPPMKIPADAPPGLIRDGAHERVKMLQYVDWSTGEFYGAIKRQFPRTLFVLVADHGQIWGDEGMFNQIPTYEQLRLIGRIPFYLVPLHPDLPETLKGRTVDALASNVDVPPTLLSLLGWDEIPQQFMGMDAFARQGPVYLDWLQKLLRIERAGGAWKVERTDPSQEELIGAVGRYNLLAPTH